MKKAIRLFVIIISFPLWGTLIIMSYFFGFLAKFIISVGACILIISNMFADMFEHYMKHITKCTEYWIKQVVK